MDTRNSSRPYFLWDYDLTEADVRRIVSSDNETEKRWLMSRLLTHARPEDVWRFTSVRDVARCLAKLKLRPGVREAWEHALTVWGYHVPVAS